MPAGRPTIFSDEIKNRIELLARKGLTDDEMAFSLGITQQTLNNWKKKSPKFFESLNDWKHKADSEVERSLYERACGYSHPETKVFCNNGEIITEEVIRHYPPDPTAMIFWLKNRQKDKWRDKQDVEHSGAVSVMKPAAITKPSTSGSSDE
jgi:transcriptional regulator with XRE-family HTH domain